MARASRAYVLGDAEREGRGGSWHGATDCLRGGYAPVYVWNGVNEDTVGNRALCALDAKPYALAGEPLSAQLGLV